MLCYYFRLLYSCTHVEPLRFKSSVLFRMNTLLDKSLSYIISILQLPTHPSNLTANE